MVGASARCAPRGCKSVEKGSTPFRASNEINGLRQFPALRKQAVGESLAAA